ncbi:MAG: hypothetical protein QM680_03775 [Luteolibacter sp.]
MKLSRLRIVLWVMLVTASAFAAWAWLRPYEWSPDPGARGKVVSTLISQDHSHYWVTVHVKIESGQSFDFEKPMRLLSGSKEIETADTTLSGDVDQQVSDLWLKFWLTREEMAAPLSLRVNDGRLTVKKSSKAPELDAGEQIFQTSSFW